MKNWRQKKTIKNIHNVLFDRKLGLEKMHVGRTGTQHYKDLK